MTQITRSSAAPLMATLGSVKRKARWMGFILGAGQSLGLLVALIFCALFLDYFLHFPRALRVLILAGGAGFWVFKFWKWVLLPVASKFTVNDLAGHLETVFPEFDDRLRSTVDFVGGTTPGSELMQNWTIEQANEIARKIRLAEAVKVKPAALTFLMGLCAALLMVFLGMTFKDFAKIGGSRLLGGAAVWPKTCQIEVAGKLPAKIAMGQRFDVKIKLVKGDRANMKPVAFVQYDNGATVRVPMNRREDGTYGAALDARGKENVRIYFKAGDDETLPAMVPIVQRLTLKKVEATILPPAYAKQIQGYADLTETPALATAGSKATLRLNFNKNLLAGKLPTLESVNPNQMAPEVRWVMENASTAVGEVSLTQSLRFRVRATDIDELENAAIEEYEVIIKPDQLPSVVIENPRGPEDRTPTSVVPLRAVAEDDFDIAGVTLAVDRLSDKKHWEIPLTERTPVETKGDRKRYAVAYEWDLSKLPDAALEPGQVLEYYVSVRDNFEYNGTTHEPQSSGKLRINIISQEALTQQIIDSMRVISDRTKAQFNAQSREIAETTSLQKETKEKPAMDVGDKASLNRLSENQANIAAATGRLAERINELENRMKENKSDNQELSGVMKDVKEMLKGASEGTMSKAIEGLNDASRKASQAPEQRNEAMDKSLENQKESAETLNKAMDRLGSLGSFEVMMARILDALKNQEALSKEFAEAGREMLGKKPGDLKPEERKKLDDLSKKQKSESEKTDKLVNELNKASEQSKKADPTGSEAMKTAADTAKQQNVPSSQSQAAQDMQENQQTNAQNKQKQAEMGLQMMLDTMRQAERRKLEQLTKELAKLRQLLEELIVRQATHNVDNLRIQETPEAGKLLTDDLLKKATLVRTQLAAKITPGQLKEFQINTQRRTKDYTSTAESMSSGGAEVSALLSKASGLMERAIALIAEPNLTEAFDPNQSKALATLEEAIQSVKKMEQEAKEKLDNANKETIRQQYEKIRTEQEKVNKETSRVDKTRAADGELDRREALSLNQLTTKQGELADLTQKIEQALSDVGGVVYVWANKDIVSSMGMVKGDLGKLVTSDATQAEEQRILDQLDAMIRNLAVKPKKKEMDNPPGGGGGGGGAPKTPMPSEAELRLLKELQMAVNKSTKTIEALLKKDAEKIKNLGGRQGDLRDVLDQMIQKSSKGKIKLEPEPDPKDRLPEEATAQAVEDQELDDWLKGGKSGDDQAEDDTKMAGQRMGRSRQRLTLDTDTGKTTQIIQDKILDNLDHLIRLAQAQQQQQSASSSQSQDPSQGNQPSPQQIGIQQQQNPGSNPATSEHSGFGSSKNTSGKDIRENATEWGSLTPRQRQAIIEGTSEKVIGKYDEITKEYYEEMGKKATGGDK